MVYPEYASLDRGSDEWSQCQQVPVVFAFVMLTINWVNNNAKICNAMQISKSLEGTNPVIFPLINLRIDFSQVLVGLVILAAFCAGVTACCAAILCSRIRDNYN